MKGAFIEQCVVFDSKPPYNTTAGYKSNNVKYSCKYHVVWCPKYRRQVLVEKIANRLKLIVFLVARETHSEVFELVVMPDHVHLLIDVDPQFAIHRFVKLVKGRSSRLGYYHRPLDVSFGTCTVAYDPTRICNRLWGLCHAARPAFGRRAYATFSVSATCSTPCAN